MGWRFRKRINVAPGVNVNLHNISSELIVRGGWMVRIWMGANSSAIYLQMECSAARAGIR